MMLNSNNEYNGMNTIDITDLNKGIYLLKINDLNETKTVKIIRQ